MFLRMINWSKVFSIAAFTVIVSAGIANASLDKYIEESKAFKIVSLPETHEKRKSIIKKIFSQEDVSIFDLSSSNINDEDISYVIEGLTVREITSKASKKLPELKLLDTSNEYISNDGIEELLKFFQQGISVNKEKIYPEVRQMIIKVSSQVDITDELLSHWHRIAPSVFAGGLTVVE